MTQPNVPYQDAAGNWHLPAAQAPQPLAPAPVQQPQATYAAAPAPAGYGAPQAPALTTNPNPGRVKTGRGRVSYFYVLARDEQGKQRTTFLVPKTDQETVQALFQAEEEAIAKKWPAKRPQYYRSAIKDGDTFKSPTNGKPAGPECHGHFFINCTGTPSTLVRVLDVYGSEITAPSAVRSGDYCRLSITFYGSDKDNNIGVNVALNSVVFLERGESLGGAGFVDAEDEFKEDFQAPPPGYQPPAAVQHAPQHAPQHAQPQAPAPVGVALGGFAPQPAAPQYQAPAQPLHQAAPGQPYQPAQPAYTPPPTQPPAPTWDGSKWVYP